MHRKTLLLGFIDAVRAACGDLLEQTPGALDTLNHFETIIKGATND